MNRRIGITLAILVVPGFYRGAGIIFAADAQLRVGHRPAGKSVQAPFSDAILSGNNPLLAGRIGLDPKTGKRRKKSKMKSRFYLDSEKDVLAQAGMRWMIWSNVQISGTI